MNGEQSVIVRLKRSTDEERRFAGVPSDFEARTTSFVCEAAKVTGHTSRTKRSRSLDQSADRRRGERSARSIVSGFNIIDSLLERLAGRTCVFVFKYLNN